MSAGPPAERLPAMNPSRHTLPQQASADRRRARQATLRIAREAYAWGRDPGGEDLPEGFRALPPFCAKLPRAADFPPPKKAWLLMDKLRMKANARLSGWSTGLSNLESEQAYTRMFRLVGLPRWAPSRWRDDVEFARQRLSGVNPMRIRRAVEVDADLSGGADAWLSHGGHTARCGDLLRDGRLFEARYPELGHERIQRFVRPGKALASPHALFWIDDDTRLMPLAIRLVGGGPVFTPQCAPETWLLARLHVQAADACVHEGTHHLLETHLVNEAVAMCLYRRVHPDHPVRQLLDPHYQGNLAIDEVARGNLLAPGGPIDLAMAAGVPGTMEAARANYATWRFDTASLRIDLQTRGMMDVPDYHYRDDALPIEAAIDNFVRSVLGLWYQSDADVLDDDELQAFCAEGATPEGADIAGFPAALADRESLFTLVTHLIFRAGPQHAAVNNGQFDAYGWVPNTPGALATPIPDDPDAAIGERALWQAMPDKAAAMAQMGMVWVLSRPTRRTLLHAGESPAFDPELCLEATEAVAAFRRRLQEISDRIRARNETLDVPYRYLDPYNISRSTDI